MTSGPGYLGPRPCRAFCDSDEPLQPRQGHRGEEFLPLLTGEADDFAPYGAAELPPGLTLQTFAAPTDADNELAGTPTTAGTFAFTMRLSDFAGQQATQSFSLTIDR
jgi:Putative Ig domain